MDLIRNNYSLIIFIFLATFKGCVELWATQRNNRKGQGRSRNISTYFIFVGSLAPFLIFAEIFFLKHSLPLMLSLLFATVQIFIWILRVISIRTLGDFYSVDVRIADDHKLIQEGIYRYFRHPIYLIALLENIFYPLACGAYLSAVVLVLIGTPAILLRRKVEEKILISRFGSEYQSYKRTTWF